MISKVIFIGANRYGEDGPLLDFVDVCRDKGIEVAVLTDHARTGYPTRTYGTFLQALRSRNVEHAVLDRLDVDAAKPYAGNGNYAVCVNCHWIVSPDVIDLFDGRIFNYHNSALPEQRGAACHSWRIMQGRSDSRLTVHELVPAVDEGRIVIEQELEYPSDCRNLEQSYAYLARFEGDFFGRFLDNSEERTAQEEAASFYWPRLNTEIHGFIDWSWQVTDIERFCAAFDRPFGGASSFLGGLRVRLRDVHADDLGAPFHPFQSGLIYRKQGNLIWVAAIGGGLQVRDFEIEGNIRLRVGMRLATPPDRLHLARLGRSSADA